MHHLLSKVPWPVITTCVALYKRGMGGSLVLYFTTLNPVVLNLFNVVELQWQKRSFYKQYGKYIHREFSCSKIGKQFQSSGGENGK